MGIEGCCFALNEEVPTVTNSSTSLNQRSHVGRVLCLFAGELANSEARLGNHMAIWQIRTALQPAKQSRSQSTQAFVDSRAQNGEVILRQHVRGKVVHVGYKCEESS